MNRPEIKGIGLMEQINENYKYKAPDNKSISKQIESFEKIKSVQIENDEIVDTQFYGDILDPININEREQYTQLMNTFLNRKQKRKLSRYKGFKSFTDRIYGK